MYDVISASDLNAESFSREKAIKECQKEINEIDKSEIDYKFCKVAR